MYSQDFDFLQYYVSFSNYIDKTCKKFYNKIGDNKTGMEI